MTGSGLLRVVEGTPEECRPNTEQLRAWLDSPVEDEDGLTDLLDSCKSVGLHPFDLDRLQVIAQQIRAAPDEDAADKTWTAIVAFAAGILDRYAFPYSSGLGRRVREIRAELRASRGPSIAGVNGGFRRGDLVARPLFEGDEVAEVEDAVFLEAEPSTPHAKRFGRMAAVHVLGTTEALDRWYLDHIFPGIAFGRPF